MKAHERLLDNNRRWAAARVAADPNYFKHLADLQTPEFLWIGCSDSRVPANEITGTEPGEIFVHRNIANMVVHTDLNMLSVLHYSVEVLKVKHIIVCGHYGCGGVRYAVDGKDHGMVNQWLTNIKGVYHKHHEELERISEPASRSNRLVELNVMEQVRNLAKTSIVQKAFQSNSLVLHGWVYGLHNGLITDLNVIHDSVTDLEPVFRYDFTP